MSSVRRSIGAEPVGVMKSRNPVVGTKENATSAVPEDTLLSENKYPVGVGGNRVGVSGIAEASPVSTVGCTGAAPVVG